GPSGEGVRLVEADVGDRLVGRDLEETGQGRGHPAIADPFPVERGRPSPGLPGGPAVGQPELGPVIAAILEEGEEFRVRGGPARLLEPFEILRVPRSLVVEGEARPFMADLVDPAGEFRPT